MDRSSAFSDVVDATEKLTLEEKETLLEVLQNRTMEERRARLKKEIAGSRLEHKAGKTRASSVKQLMREIQK